MFKRIGDGKLTESELNEMNFIMHITDRKKMYIFSVHPNYPETNLASTISLEYDSAMAHEIITDAQNFWNKNVYPLIITA